MDLKNRKEADSNGRDESVLNPETVNEADLSRKERRLLEKEKIKGMGGKKKAQYIWMYYKFHMLGVVAAILAIVLGVHLYQNARMNTVLSVSVIDSGDFEVEDVEADILKLLNTEGKYDQVDVGQNLMSDSTGKELEANMRMAYVTQIQAATIDVLVMSSDLYEGMKDEGMFGNMKEIFGEDAYKELGDAAADEYHLEFKGGELADEFALPYDDICVCVTANIKNPDNALKWLESLTK